MYIKCNHLTKQNWATLSPNSCFAGVFAINTQSEGYDIRGSREGSGYA